MSDFFVTARAFTTTSLWYTYVFFRDNALLQSEPNFFRLFSLRFPFTWLLLYRFFNYFLICICQLLFLFLVLPLFRCEFFFYWWLLNRRVNNWWDCFLTKFSCYYLNYFQSSFFFFFLFFILFIHYLKSFNFFSTRRVGMFIRFQPRVNFSLIRRLF